MTNNDELTERILSDLEDAISGQWTWSIDEQFPDNIKALLDERASLISEVERLREALTPSEETKTAYMGEFSMKTVDFGPDGKDVMGEVNIPWTTIKEIMKAIAAYSQSREAPREDSV